MKCKVEDGTIHINISELIDTLSEDDRIEVAKHVAAQEKLFEAVLDAVVEGTFFDNWWYSSDTVLKLREKLIPLMDDVAKGAVQEALSQRNRAEKTKKQYWDWGWKVWHAWPEHLWHMRPEPPRDYSPPPRPTKEEIEGLFK